MKHKHHTEFLDVLYENEEKEEISRLQKGNEFLVAELMKISKLSLDKVADYKHGYEKCREIAKNALEHYMENLND